MEFDKKIERRNTNSVKWDYMRNAYYDHEEMLPFWVADMDIQVPQAITDGILKRASHPIYGYEFAGEEYYDSIISWVNRRHQVSITKDDVIFSPGIVTGLYTAVAAFTNEGDEVLVQKPVYHPFFSAVEDQNRKLISNDLKRVGNRYVIDFIDLNEKLSRETVKMFILCSPHNPVGRVWNKEEITKICDLCVENNVILVSDEIHSDIILNNNKHHSILSLNHEIENLSVCLMAPSKTFNIAGLASGYALIKNEELRKKYNEIKASWHQSGINPFSCAATIAAYNECEEWVDELCEYLNKNYEYFKESIKKNCSRLKVIETEGTYLVLLDYTLLDIAADEMQELLTTKGHVALQRGEQFKADKCVRVNLGTTFENVQILVERLTALFKD